MFFYLKIARDDLTETLAPSLPVISPPVDEEVGIELEDEKPAQLIEEVAL